MTDQEQQYCEHCGSLLGKIPNTEIEAGEKIYICPCQQ